MHRKAYEYAATLASNKRVLDLGCNVGYWTHLLSKKSSMAFGVDVSRSATGEAQRRYGGEGVHFSLVDGVSLPFEDDQFDLVVSFEVIEHVTDLTAYLSEVKRVLTSGGTVLLTTPNAAVRLHPGMKPWNPFHVREWEAAELRSKLEEHFPSVTLLGLFATEPAYSIELSRVKRARDAALRRQGRGVGLRQWIRSKLPHSVVRWLRDVRQVVGRRLSGAVDPSEVERFSTKDFFYESQNIGRSLNLMAVCRTG
jgi:SAM-dependent methyltransferase